MADLPYEKSKCRPNLAKGRIEKMLRKFGVSEVGFKENYEQEIVSVTFEFNKFPLSFPINYGALADKYVENKPLKNNAWSSKAQKKHRDIKVDTARRAAYSIMEDLLKSHIMTVELGVFSFDEIFIGYITDRDGNRLGASLKKMLPAFRDTGQLALSSSEVIDAVEVD